MNGKCYCMEGRKEGEEDQYKVCNLYKVVPSMSEEE